MAVNFEEMPVLDGFQGCYDYTNYSGGEVWGNQYGSGADFTLYDAEVGENYVFFPQKKGRGYIPENIGNNFTFYAIVKTDAATHFSGACWGIAMCGESSSYRVWAGYSTSSNLYCLGNGNGYPNAAETGSDWHCIAVSANNGQQCLYVDGKLAVGTDIARDYAITGFYINTGKYNGAVPSADTYSLNMYLKYIGYATENHSAAQIKLNTDWLLIQYGFKNAPLDSKMSGADAAAIAWCMKYNIEQTKNIKAQIKAYRKGLSKGAGVFEPWETDDTEIEFDVGEDEKGASDVGYVDFKNGVQLGYVNPDDPTDTVTVRIFLDHSLDEYNGWDVYGLMTVIVYDKNGNEISTSRMGYGNGAHPYTWHKETYSTFTGYQINAYDGGGSVSGYYINTHTGIEYWTTKSTYVSSPYWDCGNYVYAGAQSYDTTAS